MVYIFTIIGLISAINFHLRNFFVYKLRRQIHTIVQSQCKLLMFHEIIKNESTPELEKLNVLLLTLRPYTLTLITQQLK